MKGLLELLSDTGIRNVNVNVNSESRLAVHKEMLSKKRLLREVFTEFHHVLHNLTERFFNSNGLEIELGAGVSPMRDTYPDVLATDIVYSSHLDKVLDAEDMDLRSNSVRVIYGQNCFHHFPNPNKFFSELDRVVSIGGGAILLEPYYGPFAAFLFKRLFKTEGFDANFPSWETPIAGPMSGANQALSYIVFIRDKDKFVKQYPDLKIIHQGLCGNYLKYILSGGLNFRQLIPDCMIHLVSILQVLLSPLKRWIALHHIIVIRKEKIAE